MKFPCMCSANASWVNKAGQQSIQRNHLAAWNRGLFQFKSILPTWPWIFSLIWGIDFTNYILASLQIGGTTCHFSDLCESTPWNNLESHLVYFHSTPYFKYVHSDSTAASHNRQQQLRISNANFLCSLKGGEEKQIPCSASFIAWQLVFYDSTGTRTHIMC